MNQHQETPIPTELPWRVHSSSRDYREASVACYQRQPPRVANDCGANVHR
jgi:hypothetical protein